MSPIMAMQKADVKQVSARIIRSAVFVAFDVSGKGVSNEKNAANHTTATLSSPMSSVEVISGK